MGTTRSGQEPTGPLFWLRSRSAPPPPQPHHVERVLARLLHMIPASCLPGVMNLSVRVPPRALLPPAQFALHVLCST